MHEAVVKPAQGTDAATGIPSGVSSLPVTMSRPLMGTLAEITAYQAGAAPALAAALRRMSAVEKNVGPLRSSDISRLHAAAGRRPLRLGADAWRILAMAQRYAPLTEGAFDVTAGPLVELWGFGYGGTGRWAAPEEVEQALALVGHELLQLTPRGRRALLASQGMRLAMGGIAKGYAVEEAAKILQRRGVNNALINGGHSSIKAIGEGPDGCGWRIGLECPDRPGKALGVLTLRDGQAMATSAGDKRFFVKDNRHYSHLIDPRTGYPGADRWLQVSVIASHAAVADILAKAFLLNDPAWGLAFARANGLDALLVDRGDRLFATPGVIFEQ